MDNVWGPSSPFIQPVAQLTDQHKAGKAVYLVVYTKGGYFGSEGTFGLTEFNGLSCSINFQTVEDDFEISGVTILQYSNYYFIPIQTADNLTLANEEPIEAYTSDVYGITCDLKATLTAVNGVQGFTLTSLPMNVERGKDSLGNTYYLCTIPAQSYVSN
jgi:hypothetical protein